MSKIFFHDIETPNLKMSFFKDKSYLIRKIPKTLIISGGSRNGNHLVWSLLDGNDQLPYLPGEDKFLSQIFWQTFEDPIRFKKNFLRHKDKFIRKLSGVKYDKWERIFKKKIKKERWAGSYTSISAPLQEFPESIQKINFVRYKNYISKNFKRNFNFYNFFSLYLEAFSLLSRSKKKMKYNYIYAESGLRREIKFLLECNANIKCIVPIRKFETFYFSKIKGLFGSTKIKNKYIKEAWQQWLHKTNDYLYLKKKIPNKIILVSFEDLESLEKREKTMKVICKKLGIKFQKINLIPTHYRNKVKPNSSFANTLRKKELIFGRKKNKVKEHIFPKDKIPESYFRIYKSLKKYFY